MFELRRRKPADDLTTALVQAEEEGSKLSSEELTANMVLLFGARHETTVNLIGNGLLALHHHPEQLRMLQREPSLVSAVDELLRYNSPVLTTRTALVPIEVGGTDVATGEIILRLLGAANRDPGVYARPDRLDITRRNVRPMSFRGGIHFCLGAQLARPRRRDCQATLLRCIPNLTLDDRGDADWRPCFVLRGLSKLPAHW